MSKPRNQDVPEFSGAVSGGWLERGVWLSRAWQAFGAPHHLEQARAAAQRFAELRDGQTPEIYEMCSPLTGTARFAELRQRLHSDERDAWVTYCISRDAAKREVMTGLKFSGHLRAFGNAHRADADPEWIPFCQWFHLQVDPDLQDTARGEGIVYFYVRVVNPSDRAAGVSGQRGRRLPPFDEATARALLRAERASRGWGEAPHEETTREFLQGHFRGVPNEPHRAVRKALWPGMKPGPKPKIMTAE